VITGNKRKNLSKNFSTSSTRLNLVLSYW